jgi:hypothetical protein
MVNRLCALTMYVFWWHKPFLPNEPIVLRDDRLAPLAAFMYVSSEMSGYIREEEAQSRSTLHSFLMRSNVYSRLPEISTLCFRSRAPTSMDASSVARRGSEISALSKLIAEDGAGSDVEKTRSIEHGFRTSLLQPQRCPESCAEILRGDKHRDKQQSLFEMKPRILDRRPTMFMQGTADVQRWNLLQIALANYPKLLEDRVLLTHTMARGEVCIHLKPEQLVAKRVQNFPSTDLLREIDGFIIGIMLWFASFVYGGIHAAAWNDHFPTATEMWLWRASAAYIGFAGGLWTVLLLIMLQIPGLSRYYQRWTQGNIGWIDGVILGSIMVICGTSFIMARCYIVIEAFISIRSLDVAAYDTPQWTNVFPHF